MATLPSLATLLIAIFGFKLTFQVPLQSVSDEDQKDPFPFSQGEPAFGQRLSPLFPNRRIKGRLASSTIPPFSSSSTPTTLLTTQPTEILKSHAPRSFYALGPITINRTEGTCAFDGKIYQSGENIQRKHLCHFCFCHNGYIDCYWKNCPPAPEGCVELTYEGVCDRSLYLCPIPKKQVPTAQIHKREIQGKGNFTFLGCDILGVKYRIGELVGVATDPCLECRCALDALYCSPKCCFQPAEPDDDVAQQIQRSDGYKPLQNNPLQHLRSDFDPGRQ